MAQVFDGKFLSECFGFSFCDVISQLKIRYNLTVEQTRQGDTILSVVAVISDVGGSGSVNPTVVDAGHVDTPTIVTLEDLVQGATLVVVDILAVPGLVSWRIFHGEAGQVEHLTEGGTLEIEN